ncbi:hypothetical protein ACK8GG_21135 [Micromonosporaceae bacterium DT55]|uniref:hypothetical protein n=1 Tax=Melissospora conviva TaxID=3388432 RepID=UPI003C16CBAC
MPLGVRFRPAARRVAAPLACALFVAAGCSGEPPPDDPPATTAPLPVTTEARDQLAALAAAGLDRHFTARYTLRSKGRPDRTVEVTRATDGTWRVDIPGWALGGDADIAMAGNSDGIFQCALPSAANPVAATCVRVADADGKVPADVDPRLQHPFSDWLPIFTSRQPAVSVTAADLLPGAAGTCFAIESTSASLEAMVDVGTYCFDEAGTLTGARSGFGSLLLAGPPGPAPATAPLPGAVVPGEPLGSAAPPTPTPSPSQQDAADS